MKKYLLLSSVLLIWFSCTYKKGEIPKPDLTCKTDAVIHTVDVTISDDAFSPRNIEILEGDTVKWTYVASGAEVHTSTCNGANGSTLPSGGTTWDSGDATPINPGESFKKAIAVSGTYTYICSFHFSMGMTGTIVVKPRCH